MQSLTIDSFAVVASILINTMIPIFLIWLEDEMLKMYLK